ncbi:unnamed protein product [Adineta steineri]|uniref:NAD(P)(+)--arginine ADP-ribosyltransferase n=1 Tax=Adineta steineri TaxID=433720 RepID=A0A819J6H9_9BILA|nr:unnamed protein product [Adineta steineri]CAF3925375.1 unnamed protein product [Adineta steineri]
MSGSGSNPKASLSPNTFMNNNNTTITPSDAIRPRRRLVRNYSLLCLDECMDEANQEYQDILTQLKPRIDNVKIFKQRDECIDFLTDAEENIKFFLVLENTMAQHIVPFMNDIPQLHSVYIFSNIKFQHEEWTKNWRKIKSVHTNIDDLCKVLRLGVKRYNQDSIAMSFITANEMVATVNLDQLEPTFMYTEIFKEILLDMEHDKQAIKDFTNYCRHHDCGSAKNIDQFEEEYDSQSAIWWYTYPSFIYSMLNYALRSMEGDTIINMGFFIHDLHQQIQQLHHQQINSYYGKPFIIYRGQGLSKTNFEKLLKTKRGLMSFNNFLSTSTEQDIALELAYSASEDVDMIGILFIMSIDPCIKSAPFASIREISYFNQEEEILFSMHTVFRVDAIKQMDNINQLYQVELQLTSDDDQQLRLLTDRIREEVGGDNEWERLGNLLLKIGQFNKAEELYNVLLEQTLNVSEKQHYYNQLGYVKGSQGDYENAIRYLEQGLDIQQKTLPSQHPHEKALNILEKTLPSNHPYLATSYNNIGSMYDNKGEYLKALAFYEKAHEIQQKTLLPNHPDLATSYNNIGMVYHKMGEYSKALSSHEKAFEIQQKTLPSNHPDFAESHNNIGSVYEDMGEYIKAISFYEKAIEIYQKAFPSNHPDLATSYNNIGLVYDKMGEYSKALPFHERALDILEKTLPSNHPHLATSYNNMGLVYCKMGEYSKALSFHEKAFEIQQKTLPSNHPDLAGSYNNIGLVYDNMEEYSKALSSYESALEIYQKTLLSNHPSLATSYNNIGVVYHKMGEYSKALSSHEKALEIRQKTLPSNHPDFSQSYNNIAVLYYSMKDYSKALSYFERALDIKQRTLPPTHPSIKNVKNNIENAKEKIIKNIL